MREVILTERCLGLWGKAGRNANMRSRQKDLPGCLWNCFQMPILPKHQVLTSRLQQPQGLHSPDSGLSQGGKQWFCWAESVATLWGKKKKEKKDSRCNYWQQTALAPRAWNEVSGKKCSWLTNLWSHSCRAEYQVKKAVTRALNLWQRSNQTLAVNLKHILCQVSAI